ncbi:hypothetical protein BDR22DRAFT_385864 [Usnea florida]
MGIYRVWRQGFVWLIHLPGAYKVQVQMLDGRQGNVYASGTQEVHIDCHPSDQPISPSQWRHHHHTSTQIGLTYLSIHAQASSHLSIRHIGEDGLPWGAMGPRGARIDW